MLDWNLTGQYVLLFLTDGIAGYFLHFMGYALAIHAFNKKQIVAKTFLLMTTVFSLASFGVRSIPGINFGYHTILIITICIILSYTLFKTTIYPTVLAVLLTTISILIFETLTFWTFIAILGNEKFNEFFIGTKTTVRAIQRSLMGVPMNILLTIEMLIIYNYFLKKLKKDSI